MTLMLVYRIVTGRIRAVGRIEPGTEGLQVCAADDGLLFGQNADFAAMTTRYVVEGELVDRPVLPIAVSKTTIVADDTDAAILTGFPTAAMVTVDGQTYAVQTGVLNLTSPMPATYRIACSHWPYLDWEVTIAAVAS